MALFPDSYKNKSTYKSRPTVADNKKLTSTEHNDILQRIEDFYQEFLNLSGDTSNNVFVFTNTSYNPLPINNDLFIFNGSSDGVLTIDEENFIEGNDGMKFKISNASNFLLTVSTTFEIVGGSNPFIIYPSSVVEIIFSNDLNKLIAK